MIKQKYIHLQGGILETFKNEIINLYYELVKEKNASNDIRKSLTIKYEFSRSKYKLILLARKVKEVVDDKAKYIDWSNRDDVKAELKVDLIILLAKNDYPSIDRDEVCKEIFEQAESFKKYK